MFPIPKEAAAQAAAYKTASRGIPAPCETYPMGPPPKRWYFVPRTFSARPVAVPKSADTHIQKTAPGPPMETAAATPMILPVPIEAARAVDNA